jgi:2,3-bisphosphoglycerate-independent phosphoglycerate mutase
MSILNLSSGKTEGINGPLCVVVMDGVGLNPSPEGNALFHAKTPHLDQLFKMHGCMPLAAHGLAVGLPSNGDMGNSEVGHNALGAGRIFEQGAKLVQNAIHSEEIFESDTWSWLIEKPLKHQGTVHLIGLLSDGNVHAHEQHLHAIIRRLAKQQVSRVRVHILLDGRDVGERSALIYVERLERVLHECNEGGLNYQIASGGGRMVITMDRYQAEWDMVERGWQHHVHGEGRRFTSAQVAIDTLRDEDDKVDQYLPPFVIADDQGPVGRIKDNDSVILFNFRGDRAIEISQAFEQENFDAFDRGRVPNVRYAGMMQYDGDLQLPKRFLVTPPNIDRTLGAHLAYNGISQFACSETQKFGHMTYFWNGNRTGYFDESIERYEEIPSDTVEFSERPWMKAAEIVDATLSVLQTGQYKHARINLANGDMVGHTGNFHAAVMACEIVDLTLGKLLKGIERLGGAALITADHGNCEQMFETDRKTGVILCDESGRPKPKTSHTLYPVPLSLFDPHRQRPLGLNTKSTDAGLANVPATILDLLGLEAPTDYKPSLLRG